MRMKVINSSGLHDLFTLCMCLGAQSVRTGRLDQIISQIQFEENIRSDEKKMVTCFGLYDLLTLCMEPMCRGAQSVRTGQQLHVSQIRPNHFSTIIHSSAPAILCRPATSIIKILPAF